MSSGQGVYRDGSGLTWLSGALWGFWWGPYLQGQNTVRFFTFALALYGALSELLKGAFYGGRAFFRVLPFAVLADVVPVVLACP